MLSERLQGGERIPGGLVLAPLGFERAHPLAQRGVGFHGFEDAWHQVPAFPSLWLASIPDAGAQERAMTCFLQMLRGGGLQTEAIPAAPSTMHSVMTFGEPLGADGSWHTKAAAAAACG